MSISRNGNVACHCRLFFPMSHVESIPDLGEAPMEAAILVHVHPLGPSFRPGGGQAPPLPTVNLPTLYSSLLMIALEIYHQLN